MAGDLNSLNSLVLFLIPHVLFYTTQALMACKLYKAMAHEADSDDLEVDIFEELRSYAKWVNIVEDSNFSVW